MIMIIISIAAISLSASSSLQETEVERMFLCKSPLVGFYL